MGFKTREQVITIEIDDKEYKIDASSNDFMQQIIDAGEFMQNELGKLNEIEKLDERSKLVREGIEKLVGKENAKAIFKDRPLDLVTEVEMIMYIYDAINNSDVYQRLNQVANRYGLDSIIQPEKANA